MSTFSVSQPPPVSEAELKAAAALLTRRTKTTWTVQGEALQVSFKPTSSATGTEIFNRILDSAKINHSNISPLDSNQAKTEFSASITDTALIAKLAAESLTRPPAEPATFDQEGAAITPPQYSSMSLETLKSERAKLKNVSSTSMGDARKNTALDSWIALREANANSGKLAQKSPRELATLFTMAAAYDPNSKNLPNLIGNLLSALQTAPPEKQAAFLTALFGSGEPVSEKTVQVLENLLLQEQGPLAPVLKAGMNHLLKNRSLSALATVRTIVGLQNPTVQEKLRTLLPNPDILGNELKLTEASSARKELYETLTLIAPLYTSPSDRIRLQNALPQPRETDPPDVKAAYTSALTAVGASGTATVAAAYSLKLSREVGKLGRFLERIGLLKRLTPPSAKRAGRAVVTLLTAQVNELKTLQEDPSFLSSRSKALEDEIQQLNGNPIFQALLKGDPDLNREFTNVVQTSQEPRTAITKLGLHKAYVDQCKKLEQKGPLFFSSVLDVQRTTDQQLHTQVSSDLTTIKTALASYPGMSAQYEVQSASLIDTFTAKASEWLDSFSSQIDQINATPFATNLLDLEGEALASALTSGPFLRLLALRESMVELESNPAFQVTLSADDGRLQKVFDAHKKKLLDKIASCLTPLLKHINESVGALYDRKDQTERSAKTNEINVKFQSLKANPQVQKALSNNPTLHEQVRAIQRKLDNLCTDSR